MIEQNTAGKTSLHRGIPPSEDSNISCDNCKGKCRTTISHHRPYKPYNTHNVHQNFDVFHRLQPLFLPLQPTFSVQPPTPQDFLPFFFFQLLQPLLLLPLPISFFQPYFSFSQLFSCQYRPVPFPFLTISPRIQRHYRLHFSFSCFL